LEDEIYPGEETMPYLNTHNAVRLDKTFQEPSLQIDDQQCFTDLQQQIIFSCGS